MTRRRGWAGMNPYRGWTLVERPGGLYMTRDNLEYVLVRPDVGGEVPFDRDSLHTFHEMVDSMGWRKR